ncbi:BON domain-containing protein [Massilia sp. 9096]|uniref:BON domain-containing protein n=1 Tax=Massilia sp. 9096 TaxID=1500894 RepID=UPI000563B704|nr:BON domain-containing protein [Massilia sp. 9096]
MNTSASTAALLAALMLSTATGCASSARSAANPAAERPVADAAVSTGVRSAIAGEAVLKGSEIQVDTVNGVVQLSGYVSSADDVATAAAVARTVTGVKSVRNDLRLK